MELENSYATQTRIDRRSGAGGTQEFFTPRVLVDHMLDKLPVDSFTDFSKTFLEPSAGNGNFVVAFLERRLQNCHSDRDIFDSIYTIYAVELMQDNVDEMKERIKSTWSLKYQELHKDNFSLLEYGNFANAIQGIVDHNIVCSDFFKWDFENWRPIQEAKAKELF